MSERAGRPTGEPASTTARRFALGDLRHDLVAGLVLSALLVPAGMAYAQAAGLPPVTGLYATMVPLLAYALVGPSKLLVLGPDSALASLIAATVVPLGGGDAKRTLALAGALAITGGLICVVAGLTRFGFLTELLSLPVRYGYLSGIAVTVMLSQLPSLLGFSVPSNEPLPVARDVAHAMLHGRVDATATTIGVGVLLTVLALRHWAPRVPGILIGAVGAIVAVAVGGLRAKGLATVGAVPEGLPSFAWPAIRRSDLGSLLVGGLGVAMVSFADTSVLSRVYAARTGHRVDPDRELMALGVANIAGGLFRGFSVSASQSRTPVAEAAGARSQLTGVVGAAVIAIVLVAVPGAFRDLPTTALAAVVIAAVTTLIEPAAILRLARTRRSEFFLFVGSFLAVVIAGAIRGVVVAIVLSLLVFVAKAWRPHHTVLVRVDGLKGYHDAIRHPEGREVPGLVLFRFDAPLFFANAEVFHDQVMALARRTSPTPTRWIVVTAEPVTDIDATAAAMLDGLEDELAAQHVTLAFAELKGHVREQLERYRTPDARPVPPVYRTIGEAVHTYQRAEGVEWDDWEDRSGS